MISAFLPLSEVQGPSFFNRAKKPPIQWKGRSTGKDTQCPETR